jgi:hypothetical protein
LFYRTKLMFSVSFPGLETSTFSYNSVRSSILSVRKPCRDSESYHATIRGGRMRERSPYAGSYSF